MENIKPNNVLIVRTDRIGDVVLTLPMAFVIKKKYPQCRVTYLLRSYTAPLANNNPFIDEVLILEEKENKPLILKNLSQLRARKFDAVVVVSPSFKMALMAFLLNIKNRIGTGYRWYSFFFSHKIFEHRKYAEKHELEYNVNLLKYFSINELVDKAHVFFGISTDAASEETIEHLLTKKNYNDSRPMVIIHPGSGGSARDLPLSKMEELVKIMAHELNINIVVTGSLAEKDMCDKLEAISPDNIYNFAGLLNLNGLIALINRSSIMVANSTGPIHIAAALGKYVVGFYPLSKACSKERWGPYTQKAIVFNPKAIPGDIEDMDTIETKEVYFSIKNILEKLQKVEKL